MARKYDVTYHLNGRSHTMHLSQEEIDNLLAFGDTYPVKNSADQQLKYEWKGGADNRIWWGNTPLDSDKGEALLYAGLVYVTSVSAT